MKAAFLLISFLLFIAITGNTQLCSGSLGDAIINETFGTTGKPVPLSKTNFEFSGGCPKKGFYTVANLIFGCGEDKAWLMLAGDHTRDVGGNYMLVNAQSGDGVPLTAVVYSDTAKGLCSDVNYVYSAWISNAMQTIACGRNAVLASVTLRVTTLSGIVLATIESGDIPIEDDRKWNEYGVNFQIPDGESAVVLTVLTTRKAGCGQGFLIDDITLRPCGPEVTATNNGTADPMDVCADFTSQFQLKGSVADGFASPSYQWQRSLDTGKTWINIVAATSINYTAARQPEGMILYRMAVAEGANISSPQCRFLSNVLHTNVHPLPPHRAPQDVLGCLTKDLFLPPKDPFAHTNLWTGPKGYTSTAEKAVVPTITASDTGLYLMQQDFGFGCFNLDSFYVRVYPSTTISVPPVFAICEGKEVVLNASGEGSFLWQPATGLSNARVANPVASPRDSTLYNVVVTNSFGCKDSALVKVNVYRNPAATTDPTRMIVVGDTISLRAAVSGTAIQYRWSPAAFISDTTVLTPRVFPPADMRYTLTAESTVGCGKAEAMVMVKVFNDLYIPNAFSPNNDGNNDRFKMLASDGYQLLRFQIYNRWGQIIYQSTDYSAGWDGNYKGVLQPMDTYTYLVQMRSANGKTISRTGTVTLVR